LWNISFRSDFVFLLSSHPNLYFIFSIDGRLVCAGSKDGIVRVFDFETRTQLRHFKEQEGSPVHCTHFSRDKTYIFTGSDNRTVRVLDLATEKQLSKFDHVHTDYVRALTPGSATSPHLLLSGSYDRTMKLIDRRISNNDNILMNFDHGDQIESVRIIIKFSILFVISFPHRY
jgi:U3 small nucleolar RNA-associated protein 15